MRAALDGGSTLQRQLAARNCRCIGTWAFFRKLFRCKPFGQPHVAYHSSSSAARCEHASFNILPRPSNTAINASLVLRQRSHST